MAKGTWLPRGIAPTTRFRERRWVLMVERFPQLRDMRVLDLGGRPQFWDTAPVRPAAVTTVNLEEHEDTTIAKHIQADACDLPETKGQYDLVVSNSLLEHGGGHANVERVAATVRAAAPAYWIQTPYRYFPVEPHWIAPGMQWLPVAGRAALSRKWPLGGYHEDPAGAVGHVLRVQLLSATEMRHYFPDGELIWERALGLRKSVIAVRGS